jgi:dinuclear metal center YbgI/SA1388 family protein
MKIAAIIGHLETLAPPSLQENYDNAGLLTGSADWECTGILCALDSTEKVIEEAIQKKCNLVVAHHPIIFGGIKKINGKNYVERTVIKAIKNDIAIYAIHTNLDNVITGVNGRMADILGLINRSILAPKVGILKKLITFVPTKFTEKLRQAIFTAGGGHIGNYSECSFTVEGTGTYKAGEQTKPFAGERDQLHFEPENRVEILFPAHLETAIVKAMKEAHPYEEVAYDVMILANSHPQIGSGLLGEMPLPVPEKEFLAVLKKQFGLEVVRHTALRGQPIQRVALCGGAGSFLISKALASGADIFVTADMKYHEFFDAEERLLICDIGHYESEQFTINLLTDILQQKFPTFAVLKSDTKTNPIYNYF